MTGFWGLAKEITSAEIVITITRCSTTQLENIMPKTGILAAAPLLMTEIEVPDISSGVEGF